MLTLDILICTLDARIARIVDTLPEPDERVHFIISQQYTDEKYLTIIPNVLRSRPDVTIVSVPGEGLSANRNHALSHATSDLVYFVDDDVRFLATSYDTIFKVFNHYGNSIDIALFQAQTYTGKPLREYSLHEGPCDKFRDLLPVLAIEMVCQRTAVQGHLHFDERFGLGNEILTCYEAQVWLEDALRAKLNICYIAQPIIQTSAIYVPRMIYIDAKVQRSFGALLYYVYGRLASWRILYTVIYSSRKRFTHFWPVFRHMMQGVSYLKRTPRK